MSILDRMNLFSGDQSITASTASTDLIDLGSSRDVGAGEPVQALIQIVEAFNNLDTLGVALQTSATLPLSGLTVGARFPITTVPRGALRYLRLYYTVAGTNPSTGKITAGAGTETVHQDNRVYPAGI
jgi:hypothetical protein